MSSDRQKQHLEAALQDLDGRLATMVSGADWQRMLAAAAAFHRYSPRNQLLLAAQGADGFVASYRRWQQVPAVGGGRCQVRKGETALRVWAPLRTTSIEVDGAGDERRVAGAVKGFRLVPVFYQGQLVDPPDLPPQPLPELLSGDGPERVWAAITAGLGHLGYTVEFVDHIPGGANGQVQFDTGRVVIRSELEGAERIKTGLHEWAHALLHDPKRVLAGDDETACRVLGDQAAREIEAESVAFAVASAAGLDTSGYSVPYVASWSLGDMDRVRATAERVLAAAAELVDSIETELGVELRADLPTVEQSSVAPLTRDPSTRLAARQLDTANEVPRPVLAPLPQLPIGDRVDDMLAGGYSQERLVAAVGHALVASDAALLAEPGLEAPWMAELLGDAGLEIDNVARVLVAHGYPQHEVVAGVLARVDSYGDMSNEPRPPFVTRVDAVEAAARSGVPTLEAAQLAGLTLDEAMRIPISLADLTDGLPGAAAEAAERWGPHEHVRWGRWAMEVAELGELSEVEVARMVFEGAPTGQAMWYGVSAVSRETNPGALLGLGVQAGANGAQLAYVAEKCGLDAATTASMVRTAGASNPVLAHAVYRRCDYNPVATMDRLTVVLHRATPPELAQLIDEAVVLSPADRELLQIRVASLDRLSRDRMENSPRPRGVTSPVALSYPGDLSAAAPPPPAAGRLDERPQPVLASTGLRVIDEWIGFVNGGTRPGDAAVAPPVPSAPTWALNPDNPG